MLKQRGILTRWKIWGELILGVFLKAELTMSTDQYIVLILVYQTS